MSKTVLISLVIGIALAFVGLFAAFFLYAWLHGHFEESFAAVSSWGMVLTILLVTGFGALLGRKEK